MSILPRSRILFDATLPRRPLLSFGIGVLPGCSECGWGFDNIHRRGCTQAPGWASRFAAKVERMDVDAADAAEPPISRPFRSTPTEWADACRLAREAEAARRQAADQEEEMDRLYGLEACGTASVDADDIDYRENGWSSGHPATEGGGE